MSWDKAITIGSLAPKMGDVIHLWVDDNSSVVIKKEDARKILTATVVSIDDESQHSYMLGWKENQATAAGAVSHGGLPHSMQLNEFARTYPTVLWVDGRSLIAIITWGSVPSDVAS